MNEERSFHHQRRPPDVEEALSSMLWTPYERTSNDSSSDEDDVRVRNKSLCKSHFSYYHTSTYNSLTSSYFGEDDQLEPNVAITTTPANVDNTLQSTPFVPFSNFFYNNNNNYNTSGRNHSDPISVDTTPKQPDKFKNGTFRYSYPYYGPIPSLNKWWPPSIGSKEPPSYESLYTKESETPITSVAYGMNCKAENNGGNDLSKCDNYEKRHIQREPTFNLKEKGIIQALDHMNLAENNVYFTDAEVHIKLENHNNVKVATQKDGKETTEVATMQLTDEMRTTNDRSQQTEKYNDKINNNNDNNEHNYDESKANKTRLEKHHQHLQQQCATNKQPIAMARAKATAITGVTDRSNEEKERANLISIEGEQVSQPVSCTDSSQNLFPFSHLHSSVVNNQNRNNNNNDIADNTTPMDSRCSHNGRRMNTAAMNTLTNLFAATWSDKAITTERAHSNCLESGYTEPPVVDAVTIIQSETCAFDGRVSTHHSRSSSLVGLPTYSHLWKKALSGVRTKVKRAIQPNTENLLVPATAPLDVLTPNKCLAELERLYAEFRASESALVAARSEAVEGSKSCHCQQHCPSRTGSGCSGCEYGFEPLNAKNSDCAKITDTANEMRLNIPAATNTSRISSTHSVQARQVHTSTFKVLPASSTSSSSSSSSSVFLTGPDYGTTSCLASNGQAKGINVSSNVRSETRVNNGDSSNDVDNQEIGTAAVVDDNRNGNRSNNAMVAVLPSSAICSQPSLTIHVNSNTSDQNNNNSTHNNKNNASCNRRNHYNDINNLGVDVALLNVNVAAQQKNDIKGSGVSVINCNYSNEYKINSAYTSNATTATSPVSSVSINKSISEVSAVPNVSCTVKKSDSSASVISVSAAKIGSNGNETNSIYAVDSANFISLSAQANSTQMRAQHMTNESEYVPLTRSALTVAMSSQINDSSRSPKTSPVDQQSRKFTSTECQTDEIAPVQVRTNRVPISPVSHREQRRRDRRERRQLLQQLSSSYPHQNQLQMLTPLRRPQNRHSMPPVPVPITGFSALHLQSNSQYSGGSTTMPVAMSTLIPDLLQRHFPPPYSALSLNGCATTSPPPSTIVTSAPAPGTAHLTPVISTVPMSGRAAPIVSDGRFAFPLPIIRRSPSERSGKGCCGQWFAGPPLRALIAVVALGGIACALGGAALGATGLAGPPSSHLTAALLMIGVGVVLVTVSGAAWRMTAPGGPPCLGLGSAVDLGRCARRPCGRGGGNTHGLLYPEFQHRPPPPSYQASMQEYRLRLLLLDRDRQNGVVRGNSPPPTYRSYAGSLLRASLTTTLRVGGITSSIADTSANSLPPSYRSRNTTPATMSSERSVELASSDYLLPNRDVLEPCTVQLPNNPSNSTLRSLSRETIARVAPTTTQLQYLRPSQLQTSAIVKIEATNSRECQLFKGNLQTESTADTTKEVSSTPQKELVTIVTISKSDSEMDTDGFSSGERIEILAHL